MQIGNVLRTGVLATVLASGCATVDDSKDWVDIKDADGLRAMFSNKTIKGHIAWADRHLAYVMHSKADGTGTIQVDNERQVAMTWALNGSDQVCLKWPGRSGCFNYQRHKTRAGIYRGYNPTTKRYGNDMTVTDGLEQKS